jgi:hypothetical protein
MRLISARTGNLSSQALRSWAGSHSSAHSRRRTRSLWAIALFPRGSDQVIPQVLAVFLFYLPLVFPVGRTREGLLFGR